MRVLVGTGTAERPVDCARCHTMFRAGLTAGACPVCGLEVAGPAPTGVAGWLEDPGNRVVALVVGATLANGLLLAVLTMLVNGTS